MRKLNHCDLALFKPDCIDICLTYLFQHLVTLHLQLYNGPMNYNKSVRLTE